MALIRLCQGADKVELSSPVLIGCFMTGFCIEIISWNKDWEASGEINGEH